MKVVINKCYGGFSLSPLAVKELAKRKGKECFFFRYDFTDKTYTPMTLDEAQKERLTWHAFSVPNPAEMGANQDGWHEMTDKQRQESNRRYTEISLPSRPDDRSDPDLIAVVKKLGKKASGACADLKIVQIPDGVDYLIDEYDGLEHIAEKHRTWG